MRDLQAVGGTALSQDELIDASHVEEQPVPAVADPASRHASRWAVTTAVAVAVAVVLLDVMTKQLAASHLAGRPPVKILGGAVYLVLTRNSGAAFSMGTHFTWVFPLVTIVVVGMIVWALRTLRSLPWAIAFGLILGGALGNLGDRLFRAPGPFLGQVVDFISVFNSTGTGFPVFNIADSSLTCGVALLLLLELTGRHRDGTRVRH